MSACRVLVVEDDEAVRTGIVELLADHGYEASSAVNGLDALNAAMRMHQAAKPAELILLDLMMPVMDGITFRIQQLRIPELSQIPVVVLSAAGELVRHAQSMKVAAYFSKPIDDWGLLHVMAQVSSSRG